MLTQGTISILVGCHSPIHSILTVISWVKLYGRLPKFWEFCCIMIHDTGHFGLNYLDSYEAKQQHWKAGANLASILFGFKGYDMVAGHCSTSGAKLSKLYKADKYSWILAPYWWLYLNTLVEPKLCGNMGRHEAIRDFQARVRESIESGEYRSTHEIYLERTGKA